MSAYPLTLDGTSVKALVVGAGAVALRKTRALVDAGATVRVVAPEVDPAFDRLPAARVSLVCRPYAPADIGDATLVIAATSSREINARVARDARAHGRLVNVADAPDEGNCSTPAVHRSGDLVIAVSAGGVPAVAARVRDAIAGRFADAYADAVARLAAKRAELIASHQRDRWAALSADVIGPEFCENVERGTLAERLVSWR